MENQISFSTLGNEYARKVRDKINNAENIADLKHHFAFTVINFLNEVYKEKQVDLDADDIKFDSENEDLFTLSKRLIRNTAFNETWKNSDLKHVIYKFAESINHRYIHINKHNEKTNKKIRN